MSRTAVRYTLPILAAVALAAVVASRASAGEAGHFLGLDHTLTNKETGTKVKTPEGLATRKPTHQTKTTHYQFRWWDDYNSR